jgi:heme a synthase
MAAAVVFRSPKNRTMRRSKNNPWLTRMALFTAFATWCLIGIGGVVTSKGVGMAVPDWPTTYGYNMFLFPFDKWIGGIFWEHSHRLVASGVGFLTTILAVWLWLNEERAWLRWLGVIAWFTVVIQGVLGGLRVVALKDEIGIFHAGLAQAFFCLMLAIALFLSRTWQKLSLHTFNASPSSMQRIKPWILGTTILIFAQLMLGATMRHQHAGLAVPDFPLAYGKFYPATDADSLIRYNQVRGDHKEITAAHIHVHMAHRFTAYLILALVSACYLKARREQAGPQLKRLTSAWLGLILLQAILGVVTVLKNKPADIATAHVVVGAASLALGVLMSMILVRLSQEKAPEEVAAFQPALAGSRG